MGASPGLVDFSILERLSRLRLSAHAQDSEDSRGRDGRAFSAAGQGAAPPPDGGVGDFGGVVWRWRRSAVAEPAES